MSNELRIEPSCGRCNFTKVITVGLDKDGVFTIPNKFCPNDLCELSRDVLRVIEKPDEPTEDKTRTANTIPKPARPLEVPKHRHKSSKRTQR